MAAPLDGVQFPVTGKDKAGADERSTTTVGKNVFAAAVAPVSASLSEACTAERKWRHKYTKHVVAQVEASLGSREKALAVAKAGLKYMHETFEFHRDGKAMPLATALVLSELKPLHVHATRHSPHATPGTPHTFLVSKPRFQNPAGP